MTEAPASTLPGDFAALVFAVHTVLNADTVALAVVEDTVGSVVAAWPAEAAADTVAWATPVLEHRRPLRLPEGIVAPVVWRTRVVGLLLATGSRDTFIESDLATLGTFTELVVRRLSGDSPRR